MQTLLPKVSVVIVTWNNENDIEECLSSLYQNSYNNFDVIIVDNKSSDNTLKIVEEKFPNTILLPQNENLYLTRGNNLGIKYALDKGAKYVMVLNPDTKVEPNLISELTNVILSDDKIGAVGPMLKFYKTKDQGLINSAGLFYDGFAQAYDIGFLQEDKGQFAGIREVFGVSGACILYNPKMLKEIGLYWTRIKLHLDEVELFIRAKKRNWIVKCTSSTTVWHKYMRSTDQNKLYKIDNAKKKVWLYIALRHYPLKRKLAMIKQYFF